MMKVAWCSRKLRAHGPKDKLLVFAHANGFMKQMWFPIWQHLEQTLTFGDDEKEAAVHLLALDLAGHGDSDKFDAPIHLEIFGENVLTAIDEYVESELKGNKGDLEIWGVGHSIGGTAVTMAQRMAKVFEGLVLIEPIILAPNPKTGEFSRAEDNPLTLQTLKRKNVFPSREAAIKNWTGKGAFKFWEPSSLHVFARYGLREVGDQVQLKCNPEHEAEVYRVATPIYGQLDEIICPVHLMYGESSTHLSMDRANDLKSRFPNLASFKVLKGTHFLPMEYPSAVTKEIVASIFTPQVKGKL